MTPIVAPPSFLDRNAAKTPTLYMTESSSSALRDRVSSFRRRFEERARATYFVRKPAVP